ncbi:hypothetical protein [Nitrosomonas eutropha]|uniref:hypothetical protein n=1 Tax=Nitrosomonas eutropha TaxID=916 RepID=UPI00210860AB|nr:hypothetical protein [Nitrosomonas eutropha]
MRDQPARLLERSSLITCIGRENALPHVEAALLRAKEITESFDGIGQEIVKDYSTHPPV